MLKKRNQSVRNKNMRKHIFKLTIGFCAFFFGLAWVAAYQFFLVGEITPTASQQIEKVEFDISDPDSVLPIDYKEEKLSDPKEDENNPEYFDPRGFYFNNDLPEELKDFAYFEIWGSSFDIDDGNSASDFQALNGSVLTEASNKTSIDGVDRLETFKYKKFELGHNRILFRTETNNRISYSFSGNFLVKGNFYTLDPNAKVVKGKLRKLKNGKIIAEKELDFEWTHTIGCCQR